MKTENLLLVSNKNISNLAEMGYVLKFSDLAGNFKFYIFIYNFFYHERLL